MKKALKAQGKDQGCDGSYAHGGPNMYQTLC